MRGKWKQTIPAYGGVNSRVEHCLAQCVPFLHVWPFPNYEAEMENSKPRFENENLYLRKDLEDDASVSTLMGFCLKTHTFRCL